MLRLIPVYKARDVYIVNSAMLLDIGSHLLGRAPVARMKLQAGA
jgi:hypothetical protein